MITVFTILFVVCCLVLCVLILLQSSKGGLGAGLGGGGSQSTQVFGGQGAGGFLSRWTIIFSIAFMTLSLVLAHLSSAPQSILGELDDEQVVSSEEDEVIEEGSLDVDPLGAQAEPATEPVEEAAPIKLQAPILEETPPASEPPAEESAPAEEAAPTNAQPAGEETKTPPANTPSETEKPSEKPPKNTADVEAPAEEEGSP